MIAPSSHPFALVRVVVVSALIAAVSACARTSTPDVVPADLPDAWSAPVSPGGSAPWWRMLGDETLDALIREAIAQSPDVQAAAARIAQAEASRQEARSRLWPTVDASLGYSRARINAGPPIGAVTQSSWTASLAAAYEVDAFGRNRHAVAAASHDAQAAQYDVLALQTSIAAELTDAWIERSYHVERRAILERQLALAAAQTDVLAARFAYGLVTASDLVTQEQQAESFRALLPQTVAGETLAQYRIDVLLGRPPGSGAFAAPDPLPALDATAPPSAGVPGDLVRARPDVRAAEERAIAADRRVAAAVADRLPTLRLTGSLGLQSNDLAELLDGFVWNAAISLVQPIFDGGRRRAAVRRAEAVVDERLLAYRRTLLVALREVEDALARERAQHQVIAAIHADLSLAREGLALVQQQYRLGAAEFPRVIAAEATIARSELALLDARRALLSHRVSLGRALGIPWQHAENSIAMANE